MVYLPIPAFSAGENSDIYVVALCIIYNMDNAHPVPYLSRILFFVYALPFVDSVLQ